MILHIFVAEKFVQPFINFANAELSEYEHHFYVHNKKNKFKFQSQSNLEVTPKISLLRLLKLYAQADKVIFHGLFRNSYLVLLALKFRDLSKCYWMIWGGDLYNKYFDRNKKISNRFWNIVRKFAVSHLTNFVTYLTEDFKFAQKVYGAKGQQIECLLYTSNVFHPIPFETSKSEDNKIKILVGNSATATNRHEDAFKKLFPFKNQIRLFVPLSYGNTKYGEKIKALGKAMFQDDFVPLETFMPLEEYYKLLNSIDLVVFNNDRQQGMGNLVQLLGMGKKVYIDPKTPQWALFQQLGIEVFDVNTINLDPVNMGANSEKVKNYFSKQNLISQWKKILSH